MGDIRRLWRLSASMRTDGSCGGGGDTAEDARKHHGGRCPAFVQSALLHVALPLAELCSVMSARDVADLCRSFRQLPPTLIMPRHGTALFGLHESLAQRASHLATLEAFTPAELTSVLFSQLCLYPQLWQDADAVDRSFSAHEPANPQWAQLHAAWQVLREGFNAAAVATEEQQPHPLTARQAALLRMLPPGNQCDPQRATAEKTRSRPVAMELLEVLAR